MKRLVSVRLHESVIKEIKKRSDLLGEGMDNGDLIKQILESSQDRHIKCPLCGGVWHKEAKEKATFSVRIDSDFVSKLITKALPSKYLYIAISEALGFCHLCGRKK